MACQQTFDVALKICYSASPTQTARAPKTDQSRLSESIRSSVSKPSLNESEEAYASTS
ncbi:hypothetical protein PF002_g33445 [Phytophthora fragariae]|uniref:Uncharacterized protein n=2 Tax=Phytophthora TaxID=4783 RepID=A0A6A4AN08_9STRA|nr:hypothetical protein PF006_g33533 [Phytophthora fragariae]KAE9157135.1 hypothetical protein PF002_g33445 [Phytophthora fragariae]KAE9258645.1 hypothetical protein PF001_g33295 [Phytophthora fragariae]KAE9259828.1 hypothetical protein PF008_g33266 [Phytophthora fragariae]KAE9261641.1 hypothetical protein PR003_g33849 [Phytophthora rubi]